MSTSSATDALSKDHLNVFDFIQSIFSSNKQESEEVIVFWNEQEYTIRVVHAPDPFVKNYMEFQGCIFASEKKLPEELTQKIQLLAGDKKVNELCGKIGGQSVFDLLKNQSSTEEETDYSESDETDSCEEEFCYSDFHDIKPDEERFITQNKILQEEKNEEHQNRKTEYSKYQKWYQEKEEACNQIINRINHLLTKENLKLDFFDIKKSVIKPVSDDYHELIKELDDLKSKYALLTFEHEFLQGHEISINCLKEIKISNPESCHQDIDKNDKKKATSKLAVTGPLSNSDEPSKDSSEVNERIEEKRERIRQFAPQPDSSVSLTDQVVPLNEKRVRIIKSAETMICLIFFLFISVHLMT